MNDNAMQKDEEFVTCGSDIIGPDGKYQNPFLKKMTNPLAYSTLIYAPSI